MQEIIFQVEFLSDIVLQASSNTEGKVTQLDFIPGSNFLGMAACAYEEYENSFDVFHSGKVRFGDATLLKSGSTTYKMPLSFFHEKLSNEKIYNHHHINDFSHFTQLKQLRSGYITAEKEPVEIEYTYSQKSAYDKESRRSKDSSMYGYSSLKKGSKWQFSLQYEDGILSNDIERVKTNLLGKKRLGKSKSAQYGAVEISLGGVTETIENTTLKNELVVYAKSRLALVDEEGNPTYELKYLMDGLEEKNIVYEKTQLRTSSFTPYNSKRERKDYERLCINKGSVIVLKDLMQEQLYTLQNGVGAYLSEGFGELLINPSFLQEKEFSFKKDETQEQNTQEKVAPKSDLALFLHECQTAKESKLYLANEVQEFIAQHQNLYKQKMNSQWGSIRSLCMNTKDIYTDVKQYISSGIAKDKWDGNKGTTLLDAIKKSNNPKEFTKLLSMQMPKEKDQNEKRKQEEKKDDN